MKKASANSQLIPNIFTSKNIWRYAEHTVLPQFVPKCPHGFSTINSTFQNCIKKYPKPKVLSTFGAAGRIWTADLILTKDALYLLSYSSILATKKGLEPSTSSVTGWRSNQLNYLAISCVPEILSNSSLFSIAESSWNVNRKFPFFYIF